MKRKISWVLFCSFTLSMISGCATTVRLSAANRQAIHTISVNNDVTVPKEMQFFGDGEQVAMLLPGGLIGGVIACGMAEQKAAQIKKFADANNVHIDQIVRDQFIQQIKSSTHLTITNNPADADLRINVRRYGLSVPTAYSIGLVPVLSLEASLVRQGKIVWESDYYVDPMFGGMPKYNSKDIENNATTLYQAWNLAAAKAVQHIITTI